MKFPSKANIDGDIVAYSMGFSSDRDNLSEEGTLKRVSVFIDDIVERVGCDDYDVYFTGDNNFRKKVAVTAVYKGNRSGDKPKHFQAIKDYLFLTHDGIVEDTLEADDLLGINQTEDTIICSIDKDLDQIPGWHFNWSKNQKYYVSKEDANMYFLKQMLTGDRVDNIIGLNRVGPKTADKWLIGLSYSEAKEVVKEAYKEYFPDNWEDRLRENSQLLWIRRK